MPSGRREGGWNRGRSTSRPVGTRGSLILRGDEHGGRGAAVAGRRGGPARGARARRATSCWTRARQRRARRRCATRRPRHGRGRPRPVPGHQARHRPGHRRRLLLRLPAPATADARRPPAIEERMRAAIAADHPFELARRRRDDGARRAGRARPAVQGRDPRRPRRTAAERGRDADAADELLRARPVQRPVPRAARREHRQDRAVQAARHGRRVLARRREAADAPAHLRHGLGEPGGARRLPVAARGGEEARPPPARRRARPVLLPRRLARVGVLAPQGPADLAHARDRDARAPGAARLPGGLDADRRVASGSGASPATGTSTARTCSSSSPRTRRSASSR